MSPITTGRFTRSESAPNAAVYAQAPTTTDATAQAADETLKSSPGESAITIASPGRQSTIVVTAAATSAGSGTARRGTVVDARHKTVPSSPTSPIALDPITS